MKNFIEAIGNIMYPYQKREYKKVETTKLRWNKVGDKWLPKYVKDDRPLVEWTWDYEPPKKSDK